VAWKFSAIFAYSLLPWDIRSMIESFEIDTVWKKDDEPLKVQNHMLPIFRQKPEKSLR